MADEATPIMKLPIVEREDVLELELGNKSLEVAQAKLLLAQKEIAEAATQQNFLIARVNGKYQKQGFPGFDVRTVKIGEGGKTTFDPEAAARLAAVLKARNKAD